MDFTITSGQRHVVNPVWTHPVNHGQSPFVNVWPVRHQSRSRRLYGNSRLKTGISPHQSTARTRPITTNTDCGTDDRMNVSRVSLKLELDAVDKRKSYTSMAFCSTSKVKYMPLPGSTLDPFVGLKLGTPHPTIFPILQRPLSRPVLMHSKRYTVITSDLQRLNTALSHSDPDEYINAFKQDRNISDQRNRFNDTERKKISIKSRGTVEGGDDEYQLQRNYCLSGRQIKIRYSKPVSGDKMVPVKPELHFKISPGRSEKSLDDCLSSGRSDTINVPETEREQTSLFGNSNSIITVDIVDKVNLSAPSKLEETRQSIEKVLNFLKDITFDEDTFVTSKEWLLDYMSNYVEKYAQFCSNTDTLFDIHNTESSWEFLQPILSKHPILHSDEVLKSYIESYKNIFGLLESNEIDVVTFLEHLPECYNDGCKYYWSKIFEELQIENINESLFLDLISIKLEIHCVNPDSKENENVGLIKLIFWLSLFKAFLDFNPMVEDWIAKCTLVTFNDNAISSDLRSKYEEEIYKFISDNFKTDQSKVTISNFIQTIPWILRTHKRLFGTLYSIDELAKIQCCTNLYH